MDIIKSNLKQMWRKTPFLFIVIIAVQIMVSFSTLYVIGSIANDYYSLKEDRLSTLNLDIFFPKNDNTVLYSELEKALFEIDEDVLSDSIDYVGANYVRMENGCLIITTFTLKDGKYALSRAAKSYLIGEGRNFTDEEYADNKLLALTEKETPAEIEINGCKIKVIGQFADIGYSTENVYLSPAAFKNAGLPLDMCEILLNRILTEKELSKVDEILAKYLGTRYRINLKTMTNEDANAILRSSLLVSSVIALTSVSLLIMVYAFVLKLRKRNMAICRLTGCSKRRMVLLLVFEMSIITLPFIILGILIFDIVKRIFLVSLYPYLRITHTLKLYLVFGIMITALMLIMFIIFAFVKASKSIRTQIVDAGL